MRRVSSVCSRGLFVGLSFVLVSPFVSVGPLSAAGSDGARAERAAIPKIDQAIKGFLNKYDIPGATIAVMKDGRLVYAAGYGYADKARKEKAVPENLFRIASVSKTITAIAILQLVQEGKLSLDERAFEILGDLHPPVGSEPDPRLGLITVKDLLRHSGGWVTAEAGDPQFMSLQIAEALGTPSPPDVRSVIRYWMGQPLQFTPGTRYSYSNFGYNVLGRIIEKRTGMSYEDEVLSRVLLPAGVRRMKIGATLKEQRADGEGAYHANPGEPLMDAVYPALGKVPEAYGGWSHAVLDSHGGWIASAVDLLRFLRVVEGSGGQAKLLDDGTLATMTQYQGLPGEGQSPAHYYALGWNVDSHGTPQEEWSHTGALSGSNATLLTRRVDGISYAVLFNSLPTDFPGFFNELTPGMRAAVNAVPRWPEKDLFPKYP
jgi:N-acyl-D-amino-acid deacylase